jgi:hypothetical protein
MKQPCVAAEHLLMGEAMIALGMVWLAEHPLRTVGFDVLFPLVAVAPVDMTFRGAPVSARHRHGRREHPEQRERRCEFDDRAPDYNGLTK